MIEVRNLVKQYGDQLAVDHLSFTVQTGQIYGFLGPNGAGKSTTMNMMTGYLGPTSGEVLVDGHSILEEPDLVKQSIGYLPEQPPLYTEMTVDEYLAFAAEIKKVPKAGREEQLAQIMTMTHLTEVRGRLIGNLSKGYRQRVGLAQALIGFPEIIILDEPTVGLDPQQIIEIRALIKKLAKDHTILLSSHILSEVQAICDHILIIHHGKMIASGSPDELEQQMSDGSRISLLVRHAGAPLQNSLLSISGVQSVRPEPCAEPDTAALTVEVKKGCKDLREQVFAAVCGCGGAMLEMHTEKAGLEEIFLSLIADSANREQIVESRWKRRKKAKAAEPADTASADDESTEMTSASTLDAAEDAPAPEEALAGADPVPQPTAKEELSE